MSINQANTELDYTKSQLKKLLPVDRYGVHMQLRTTTGQTNWVMLSPLQFEFICKMLILPDQQCAQCEAWFPSEEQT